jgi:hypothetical protein
LAWLSIVQIEAREGRPARLVVFNLGVYYSAVEMLGCVATASMARNNLVQVHGSVPPETPPCFRRNRVAG